VITYEDRKRLQAFRINHHCTQEEIAAVAGVSRQTVSNWETDRSLPDIISLLKLSEYYGISVDVLIGKGKG
jgi:transcriptional regulator with XRE-family HTH domain